MLSLCCQSYELFTGIESSSVVDLQQRTSQSLDYIASHFGTEIAQFIDSLLNPALFGPSQQSPIFAVSAKFSGRLLAATDVLLARFVLVTLSASCGWHAHADVVMQEWAFRTRAGARIRKRANASVCCSATCCGSVPTHFDRLQFDIENSFRK
jgi:hypothetical protein